MNSRGIIFIFAVLLLITIGIFFNGNVYAQFASSTPSIDLSIETSTLSNEATSSPAVSTVFATEEQVYLSEEVKVRSSSGLDSKILGSQASGTPAIIIGVSVFADDIIWWNLDYRNGIDGWVPEDYIKKVNPTPKQETVVSYSPTKEVKITNLVTSRSNPSISGNRIVWQDNRSGNADIYLYDLVSKNEQRLTAGEYQEIQPSISGNNVVYLRRQPDQNNSGHDISLVYLFDLAAKSDRPLTPESKFQSQPAISGNYVVYIETKNGERTLYLYNLSTNTKESIATSKNISKLQIAGNFIVWIDVEGSFWKVYTYDIQKHVTQKVTNHTIEQINPAVSDTGKVIFAGRRSGGTEDWHIFLYDIVSETEQYITGNSGSQPTDLAISSNFVSWSQSGEVFLYNLNSKTETQLTKLAGSRGEVSIDGSNLIWTDSRTDGSNDIYMWNIE
ncbi:MAG: hypothetical protein WCW87_03860 [Candidatus Paceibacterota bacterium]